VTPSFTLQSTTDFATWAAAQGATNSIVDSTHIEWRLPRPADPQLFFRALAVFSTNDLDGDGLPLIAETGLGTNPNLGDTDMDGFSDGAEVLAGTDPLDIMSFPMSSGVPLASFTDSVSTAVEGHGGHSLTVTFDRPASGTLHYQVNPRSTAVPGIDYQALSGTVAITGSTAQILIVPINDLTNRSDRTLTIDLVEMTGYRIGVGSFHAVRLVEDDTYWNGVLKDKYAERNFRLLLNRSNNVTQACFVAGEGLDGLPMLDTTAPGTSISEGIIPAECHEAQVSADSTTLFSLLSPELSAGNNVGIFAGNVSLARTFQLAAMTANTNHLISSNIIVGTYTERIGITNTSASYLDQTNTGSFVLVRELPTQVSVTNGAALPPLP